MFTYCVDSWRCMSMTQTNRTDHLWQPATFAERGAAIPFTTPMLAGARARGAPRGLEIVVPHPAGVRGLYILRGSEIANYCAATVHDLLLGEQLARLSVFSPATIRQAARAVAKEGSAGRKARDAALAADSQDQQRRVRTNGLLLRLLVQQTGGGVVAQGDLGRCAKLALVKLAATHARPAEALMSDIAMLGDSYAELGIDGADGGARCRRVAGQLGEMHDELAAFGDRLSGASGQAAAQIVASAASALHLTRRLFADAEASAADLPRLLGRCAASTADVASELERAEWLLDGWERISLLWRLSRADGAERAAIQEIMYIMPRLPAEAQGWAEASGHEAMRAAAASRLPLGEDWRASALVADLVARNELIRAVAA